MSTEPAAGGEEALWDELGRQANDLDLVLATVGRIEDVLAQSNGLGGEGEAAELYFAGVEAFVHGLFLPMFGWRVDNQSWHWCDEWFRHAEAIWRLETLWRSWEAARLSPTGMSSWSVELDRQMPMLMGPDGVMGNCATKKPDELAKHREEEAPMVKMAPSGWFN